MTGRPATVCWLLAPPYLLVRIRTVTDSVPRWRNDVEVYLWERVVVGIERR